MSEMNEWEPFTPFTDGKTDPGEKLGTKVKKHLASSLELELSLLAPRSLQVIASLGCAREDQKRNNTIQNTRRTLAVPE